MASLPTPLGPLIINFTGSTFGICTTLLASNENLSSKPITTGLMMPLI
jgi:hypothetical protein